MKLSARNQLKGQSYLYLRGAVKSIVTLDIGGGKYYHINHSKAAVDELKLAEGSDAYAIIKATSVMIGIDD